jgi:hypothetical protein
LITAAVGDSIQSKIGKPQKEKVGQATGEKRTHTGNRSRSANELCVPDGDHGDRPARGWHDAEAGTTAKSRFGTTLIPCRTIERDWQNMVDVLLSLSEKYI